MSSFTLNIDHCKSPNCQKFLQVFTICKACPFLVLMSPWLRQGDATVMVMPCDNNGHGDRDVDGAGEGDIDDGDDDSHDVVSFPDPLS